MFLAGLHNSDAAVLTVAPITKGFGNTDFKAYNIDFANRATVNGVEIKNQTGPSAAVFTTASNTSFYGCSFKSYQDTVYVGRNSSAFFFGESDSLGREAGGWLIQYRDRWRCLRVYRLPIRLRNGLVCPSPP